jgi:hypothetical protein
VVTVDSQPVPYAYVMIGGGLGRITDEKGEVNLGAGKISSLSATVRRIGFQPWGGKLDFPDTVAVMTVVLSSTAQTLAGVRVTGAKSVASLTMRGFYDRWQMREKGLLSATFIGPEEIEFRHPDKITNMLYGLNGVSFRKSVEGEQVAYSLGGTCMMAVVVDGMQQCPMRGCIGGDHSQFLAAKKDTLNERVAVLIDRILDANDITAIEVYTRGGNMPTSLQISDPGCGVIAFWTGSRKP